MTALVQLPSPNGCYFSLPLAKLGCGQKKRGKKKSYGLSMWSPKLYSWLSVVGVERGRLLSLCVLWYLHLRSRDNSWLHAGINYRIL